MQEWAAAGVEQTTETNVRNRQKLARSPGVQAAHGRPERRQV